MSEEQQPPPPLPPAAAPAGSSTSFKPPRLTNRQALDLRKQAVMGAANHHLDAVQEDALDDSMQECSLASEPGQQQQQQHARQRSIPLGSWDAYWDSRQQVEVSGR